MCRLHYNLCPFVSHFMLPEIYSCVLLSSYHFLVELDFPKYLILRFYDLSYDVMVN